MPTKVGVIKYTLSDHFLADKEGQKHWPSQDTHKHNIARFRDHVHKTATRNTETKLSWRRHQMETFSALLALCVWGIRRSPVNSPHKGQWRGAVFFYLICAWINGWVNNREAGDLKCHRAHWGVSVLYGKYKGLRYQATASINANKKEYIQNSACARVTNCFSAHERVILVFISRVAKQKQFVTRVHTLFYLLHDITNP